MMTRLAASRWWTCSLSNEMTSFARDGLLTAVTPGLLNPSLFELGRTKVAEEVGDAQVYRRTM